MNNTNLKDLQILDNVKQNKLLKDILVKIEEISLDSNCIGINL